MKNKNRGKKKLKKYTMILFICISLILISIVAGIGVSYNEKNLQTDKNGVLNEKIINLEISNDIVDNAYENIDISESDESSVRVEEAIDDKSNGTDNKDLISDTEISDSENVISKDSIDDGSTSEDSVLTYYGREWVVQNESGTVASVEKIDADKLEEYFIVSEIPSEKVDYITGKSYTDNPNISLEELRYIKLIHFNFNHEIQIGEIIVNEKIADEIKTIFLELYKDEYEIYSMYLPDRFWDGDPNSTDTASCDANNTSGFFYRTVEGSTKLSNHSFGMAIDINPRQNPYVSLRSGSPVCEHENALEFLDRDSGKAHMITTSDKCYKLFADRGYTWGGAWKNIKDYQHFEK